MFARIPIERMRNIGIAAHIDAGKTTLTERILFYAGRIHKTGEVHDGAAAMDWMEQEKERGITIVSAATTIKWKDHQINLIDTPGHVDFTAEVERCLSVLDGVIAVFCAVGGVEPQSEAVWRQAEKYGIPVVAFVNKMDRDGADFFKVVEEMKSRLAANPIPVTVPIMTDDRLAGIINLVEMNCSFFEETERDCSVTVGPIPRELQEYAASYRGELEEKVSELDDALMEKYIEGVEISQEEIRGALRSATMDRRAVPVLCGAAFKNKGVRRLLNAVVYYLPSPADCTTKIGKELKAARNGGGTNENSPAVAMAFKVISDKHMGRGVYLRVYAGTLRKGDTVFNATRGQVQRIGRLMQIHANRRELTEEIRSGGIGMASGLSDTFTGDTLCDPQNPMVLGGMDFPAPVVSARLIPCSVEDRLRLSGSLAKLSEEDPTFQIGSGETEGEVIISGMGELHLEVLLDRLKREYQVSVDVSDPEVAYRESIRAAAEVNLRHVKQSGGRGQYAHIQLRLEPAESGKGFTFIDKTKGGAIPSEYIPAIRKGIADVLAEGVLAGYPVIDLTAVLLDGSHHEVDSSEMAFRTCARKAFKQAFLKASPRLLEPVMTVHITCPEPLAGAVNGDLCSRRGRIQGMEMAEGASKIHAVAPMAEMLGYATTLRTLTSGRGTFHLAFDRYDELPEKFCAAILERQKESQTRVTVRA